MMRKITFLFVVAVLLAIPSIAQAQDDITYTSQPDTIAVFLNNVTFAQDDITLPANADIAIVLPSQVFTETIVLREDGVRVPEYRITRDGDRVTVRWRSDARDTEVREISLTYLLVGMGWTPRYDMWLNDTPEAVTFDFFAEITNNVFDLTDAQVSLINGRVDTAEQLDNISRTTTNQYLAEYDNQPGQPGNFSGDANIQFVYALALVTTTPGDVIYRQMVSTELPARRLFIWNAPTDQQVSVIYKVRNETGMPFAEGIVRSYQNGLFVGSDFIELTPPTSEGSVTIGELQDVRVSRGVTRTAVPIVTGGGQDTRFDITLSLTNFGGETVAIEVVDRFPADAIDFKFSDEPEREENNILRWIVTLEPGESREIIYGYIAN